MREIFTVLEQAVQKVYAEWLKPVAHADVVLQVQPVWANAKTLRAIVGLNREQLNRMVKARKVIAKLADGNVLYKVADVLAEIENYPTKGENND